MEELLDKISKYWSGRSQGYCNTNIQELDTFKREAWIEMIHEYIPKVKSRKLKVLDIGTGPGFLAIIMASCGYDVTAVDYSGEMIAKAKKNAEEYNLNILFKKMDAQCLNFEDSKFDLIISRNLTWNLEKPEEAYQSWYRVLVKGGRLLNFDANWYLYIYDLQKRKEYEQDRLNARKENFEDHCTYKEAKIMEDIAKDLPLSKVKRPLWDANELINIGFKKIMIEVDIGKKVWNKKDLINYNSTPMFMIGAEK